MVLGAAWAGSGPVADSRGASGCDAILAARAKYRAEVEFGSSPDLRYSWAPVLLIPRYHPGHLLLASLKPLPHLRGETGLRGQMLIR